MIFDSIDRLDEYKQYNPHLNEVISFLKMGSFLTLEKGRHTLNESVYFLILEYELKDENVALWEAHRRYLDLQIMLQGHEKIAHSYINEMTPTNEYVAKDDYQLFEGPVRNYLKLDEHYFSIFAPQDVHKTSVKNGWDMPVRKLVFKLPI